MPTLQILRFTSLVLAVAALPLAAQRPTPSTGPVVTVGGPTFEVPDPSFATPTDHVFKAVFEVSRGASDNGLNEQLGTMARFLNMHAKAGIPAAQVQVAAVIHGTAGKDLLNDATHQERFGTPNPNRVLIEELVAAGATLVLCGQTAMGRDLPPDKLLPGVKVALSAMTALNVLQADGYRLNPW